LILHATIIDDPVMTLTQIIRDKAIFWGFIKVIICTKMVFKINFSRKHFEDHKTPRRNQIRAKLVYFVKIRQLMTI